MSVDGFEIVGGDAHPPESSVKLNGPPGTGKTTQLLERLIGIFGISPGDHGIGPTQ